MTETPPAEPDPAVEWRTVKTGVLLDIEPDSLGEWLADAAAFDAAGADALWIESGPGPQWDVLALTAALAALTARSLLVVAVPESGAPTAGLTRTLDTLGDLSRGRLTLITGPLQYDMLPGPDRGIHTLRRVTDEPDAFTGPGKGESQGVGEGEGQGEERWEVAPTPRGRMAWREARVDAAERGVRGLVLPADPMLLDLLRNPDPPGGRGDPQIAQG